MRVIREPPNTGGILGLYIKGWEKDRPTLIIVPDTKTNLLRYVPLFLTLYLRGAGLCIAWLPKKKSVEEHQTTVYQLHMYLRFAQELAQTSIGYVGDKEGSAILSRAVLPHERLNVLMRPLYMELVTHIIAALFITIRISYPARCTNNYPTQKSA